MLDGYECLASLPRSTGNWDESRARLEAYVAADPDNHVARFALGALESSQGRDRAETLLRDAADRVRVMAVGPGPIFTDFHEKRAAELGQTHEEYKRDFGADTMLDRPGTPREVANAILFVASEEASFMTGTCVFVDGGQTSL